MKTLKNYVLVLLVSTTLAIVTSCKKDKQNPDLPNTGTITHQNIKANITSATYRNGDNGTWVYFNAEEAKYTVQVRFANVGEGIIPLGTFTLKQAPPYDPKINFSGGKLGISTANSDIVEEFTSGTVGLEKNGDRYKISVNVMTAKGAVVCEYDGVLIKQGS
jgi:hypothetical protein